MLAYIGINAGVWMCVWKIVCNLDILVYLSTAILPHPTHTHIHARHIFAECKAKAAARDGPVKPYVTPTTMQIETPKCDFSCRLLS